jgi:hypothetical protein
MRQQDLRRRLQAQLGERVSDALWAYLCTKGFVTQTLEGQLDLNGLAAEVWEVLEAAGRTPRKSEPPRMLSRQQEARAAERELVLSILFAQDAAQDRGVVAFRTRVLKGRLLQPGQVGAWIRRQAKAAGPPTDWLTEVPVPRGSTLRRDPQIYVAPPLTLSRTHGATGVRSHVLQCLDPVNGQLRKVPTAAGSRLEHLRLLSEVLAGHYRWAPAQAALFILTALIPYLSPITVVYELSGIAAASRITLEVDPTLTPRQVAVAYRHARQSILMARPRALSQKHLRLAAFIARSPVTLPWRDRMSAWNRKHEDWRYTQESNFRRDCAQVRKRLLTAYMAPFPTESPPGSP